MNASPFPPYANTLFRIFLWGGVLGCLAATLVLAVWIESDWFNDTGMAPAQPVKFSHAHHAGELGIDCRYCHQTVEKAASAGFPPTHTCMSCHSQIWTGSEAVAPVRQSFETGKPLPWRRVYNVPDFAYFNHSAHVNNGVGCETCHGRVDRMPRIRQVNAIKMSWCLDCHRDPGPKLRPRDAVFTMGWTPPAGREERDRLADDLLSKFDIHGGRLTNCYVCHR